jgi:hypothetical protein
MQSSSVHKTISSVPPSSNSPYEGPSRPEILLLISRWNAAHHRVDHIIAPAPTELDISKIESLKTLDRERLMKGHAVDKELEFLVKDIEMIRKANTKSDLDEINWERVDGGIETLKKMRKGRKLMGKGVNYVAPTLPPRKSEQRGGIEAWVTQSEDQSFREAVNSEGDELSFAEKRPREKERQSDLRDSDQKVEKNTEDVLKEILTQGIKITQGIKGFKEMITGGRNQEEEERVRILGPEVGPNRKYEYGPELSEVKNQALPRRNPDGNQPRKYVPREAVRTGTPDNRAKPETPGKLQKPNPNVPNPQRGTFCQAPFHPQTPKDQHHSKAHHHQLPVPVNQVRPRSPAHQIPVHVIGTPNKIPDHQKPVNVNTPSRQDLQKRRSHQQLRPPTPRNLHKAVSHQHLPTTTSRTGPKGPAKQQNPQKQYSSTHGPRPKKKVSFYEERVEPMPPVNQARSQSPIRQQPASYQNQIKSNMPAPKGTYYQQPTEANYRKDPTRDPANKVMFNRRPRVATDLKVLMMQKAQDEARALASEIRKMED